MAGIAPRTISINCSVNLFSGDEDPPAPCCTVCREILDLHQPDIDRPDRFLATCGNCGAWHVLEQPEDGRQTLLVRLPDFTELVPARHHSKPQRPRAKSG